MAAVSFKEIAGLIKEAKNPLILTGAKSSDYVIEQMIKLSDSLNVQVAATGNTIADLLDKGFSRCSKEWLVEIVNNMLLSDWKGIDGKGKPDLLIFVGYLSGVLNQLLSTLKIYSGCKTLTLDNRYLSNAVYSLNPSSAKEWENGMDKLVKEI